MSRRGLILIVIVLGIAALLVARSNRLAPAPHESFGMGECVECHENPPEYHLDVQWALSHGRVEEAIENRCETCHSQETCTRCHSLAPASHTENFRDPGHDVHEADRHAVFGRARPSTCLVCHRSLATECATCHMPEEIQPWVDRGRQELERWAPILGDF
jgi:hypothetical protein